MTPHISVDLETFGSASGCALASIGAVAFDPMTGLFGRTFYRIIDPTSCQRAGLTLDASTVKWWLTQSDAARRAIAEAGEDLAVVLQQFSFWWQEVDGRFFWSHGGNFDEPVLSAAYRAAGQKTPWKYSASRCTRTIFDLAEVAPDRSEGAHHNALDDAMAQAQAVCEAFHRLGLRKAVETPQEDDGLCCLACDKPFVVGDAYYPDVSGGFIHADCCGPERESYVGDDGEPLKPGEPIPEPLIFVGDD